MDMKSNGNREIKTQQRKVRPTDRSLVSKYKKGPCTDPASYRFLAIADLHGLIQEQLLMNRIANSIHRSIEWHQTGYRFDARNHHFTLCCLLQEYSYWNRCFIAIFADFVHAFPRCWRDALLYECHQVVGLKDGAFALLGSIMKKDVWRISLSGDSCLSTTGGIPEGSKYGPPCFNLLPNSLIKRLQAEQCGISTVTDVPQVWKGHVWTGRGSPNPVLVRL